VLIQEVLIYNSIDFVVNPTCNGFLVGVKDCMFVRLLLKADLSCTAVF